MRFSNFIVGLLVVIAAFAAAMTSEIVARGATVSSLATLAALLAVGTPSLVWLARRDRIALATFAILLAMLLFFAAAIVIAVSGFQPSAFAGIAIGVGLIVVAARFIWRQRSPREPLVDVLREVIDYEASVREDNGVEMGVGIPARIVAAEIAHISLVFQSCVDAVRDVDIEFRADVFRFRKAELRWGTPLRIRLEPAEVREVLVPLVAVTDKTLQTRIYPVFRALGPTGARLRPWRAPGAVPPPQLWQSLLGVAFFLPSGDLKTDLDKGHLLFDVQIEASTSPIPAVPDVPESIQRVIYRREASNASPSRAELDARKQY